MRADMSVPNVALAVQAGQARKETIVVYVEEFDRMRRYTRNERIYIIQPRLCFPILRIRPYADGSRVWWNASVSRTGFNDVDSSCLSKWIGLKHCQSSSSSDYANFIGGPRE